MAEAVEILVTDGDSWKRATAAAAALCRRIVADGKTAKIRAEVHEEDRTLQANAFYWGVVLRDISEQARVAGVRYAPEAWHELGKRLFLGYEVKKVSVAGRKRKTVIRRLRSTTDLKIRAFAKYLEQFMAYAVTDLGVRFIETRWEDYRA